MDVHVKHVWLNLYALKTVMGFAILIGIPLVLNLRKIKGGNMECEGCTDFPSCILIHYISESNICPCCTCLVKCVCKNPCELLNNFYLSLRLIPFKI